MSVSSIQREIERLQRQAANLQKKTASEQEKARRLREDIARYRQDASRSRSTSTTNSKLRQAQSKERDLTTSEGRIADLMRKRADTDASIARAVERLRRAERDDTARLDREAKKRRDDEARHAKAMTRETERQAAIRKSMPTGEIRVDFAKLPTEVTVAYFAANPLDTDALALDEEIRLIQEQIRKSEFRDAVRLESRWAMRPMDLLQALNELSPTVVHISGHGDTDSLLFQDDTGRSAPVGIDALVQLMRATTDRIQLVVLNTCSSSKQAQAVADIVGAAIGMNTSIGDEAARVYASALYGAIGFGRSLDEAHEQGIAALMLSSIPEEDTPSLFVRADLDAAELVLVRP